MMKITTPLIQVKVHVNGRPIQEYHKDQAVYVEGKKGSNFELSLKNLTGRRLLVHPTVDGLSAMTGEEASRNDHEHGYVLGPYQHMLIPGWRLNNDSVARFFFAGEGKSYAEKTGRPLNKGVIAAAVWEEKRITWRCSELPPVGIANPWSVTYGSNRIKITPESSFGNDPVQCYYSGEEKCSGKISTESSTVNNLGTGFGKKADHHVHDTHFTPERDEPNAIAVIYYDDFHGLQKRGIKVQRAKDRQESLPNPFPRDKGCSPPHGWRG
jgi:hypothetical protein